METMEQTKSSQLDLARKIEKKGILEIPVETRPVSSVISSGLDERPKWIFRLSGRISFVFSVSSIQQDVGADALGA